MRTIDVRLRRSPVGTLTLAFTLEGDIARIRVPSPRRPRIAAELWEHTCFEAFVAVEGRAAYHELNYAPSGEWAAHAFLRYREGGPIADEGLAPGIAVRAEPARLELEALVPLGRLSPEHSSAPLRLGLAAVVEAIDGQLSYWALRHPEGKPDFHHADGFALRLEPPVRGW